jgi:hypothetical protein
MKKEIYLDTCKTITKAADALYNYKEADMNFQEYKKYLRNISEEIYNKQQLRIQQQSTKIEKNLKERLSDLKHNLFRDSLNFAVNTNRGCSLYKAAGFKSDVSEDYDWNYYSKSYRHPKKFSTTNFYFNYDAFNFKYKNYVKIDGIVNTQILSFHKCENYILLKTKSIIRKKIERSINWVETSMYIAMSSDMKYAYHSEKSIKHAIKGLQNKIKKETFEITSETLVTCAIFKKITGACQTGIENWLLKHNFTRNTKMKAIELLQILKNENEYGWQKLESAIHY